MDPTEQKKENSPFDQPYSQSSSHKEALSLLCPICEDIIAKAIVTNCGHTFCQYCLNQRMLFLDECAVCNQPVRNQRLNYNMIIDDLIRDYIQKQEPEIKQQFQHRMQTNKQFNNKKKLKEITAGQKVDVRDNDYVWCTGIITRTMNKLHQRKVKYMVVRFDHNHRKQEFPQYSPRVANLGFYTGRQDLPKYVNGVLSYGPNKKRVPRFHNDSSEQEKQQSQLRKNVIE